MPSFIFSLANIHTQPILSFFFFFLRREYFTIKRRVHLLHCLYIGYAEISIRLTCSLFLYVLYILCVNFFIYIIFLLFNSLLL
jgi:hypothetical protein